MQKFDDDPPAYHLLAQQIDAIEAAQITAAAVLQQAKDFFEAAQAIVDAAPYELFTPAVLAACKAAGMPPPMDQQSSLSIGNMNFHGVRDMKDVADSIEPFITNRFAAAAADTGYG
jgi:hypothetical protein